MPRRDREGRPRLVSVNFFPAFVPAVSGGELRYLNLYRALSEYCDVELLTSTDFGARYEEVWHTAALRERRFPKDDGWRRAFQALESSGVTGDLSGLAFALATSEPNCPLRRAALRSAQSATALIHEFPYSEVIFRDSPPRREIYNSHNFELGLLSSNLSGDGSGRCFQKLFHLERNLAARAELVFATSEADGERFRLLYDVSPERLRYCPNGYSEAELAPVEAARRKLAREPAARPQLLFLASRHQPNIEAAEFLIELAAELRECEVSIAGGVSEAFSGRDLPPNLRLTGPLGSSEKEAALTSADLFLNPVVRGSGTSLKSVEALAGFLPMVATPEAIRGLGVVPGRHAIVSPRRRFAEAVRSLLADRDQRARIADAGLALARERYTWPKIARQFLDDLQAHERAPGRKQPRQTAPRRPLVLALNDYPIDAPFGGSVRIKEVLRALETDVVLFSFGPAHEITLLAPGFLQVTVEKSPRHQSFERKIDAGQEISANDVAASLFVCGHAVLADLVAHLASRSTVATVEHCYMGPVVEWLRRARPDLPIVYDAHNVEAAIKRELLAGHPRRTALLGYVDEVERRLVAAADLVVTCTEEDAAYFRKLGAAAMVVGNGCAPAPPTSPTGGRVAVGFLGSAHPPNVEAAAYIIERLAPTFPEAAFEFVGGVCDAIASDDLPANVSFLGVADEAAKSRILGSWNVALNPVLTGGGSSLKLPDYLAHGVATISTPQGARGIAVEQEGMGRVVERDEFPSALWHLLADDGLRSEYARKAGAYALEHLGWDRQTAPLRRWLEGLGSGANRGRGQGGRSLLVVTYRYTEPPLGGAEEYLIEVLRWLRPQFTTVELAAVDTVGPLTNRHHFGCGFTAGAGAARVLGELFDAVRLFAPDPAVDDAALLATCRQLERAQLRGEFDLYGSFAGALRKRGEPMPFGGFYWPEESDGKVQRWTAGEFSFLLPRSTRLFCLDGWTPQRKQLVVSALDGDGEGRGETTELYRQYVEDSFSLKLALPENVGLGAIHFAVDEHLEPSDHRPLGVLLDWAAAFVQSPEDARPGRNRPPVAVPVSEIAVDLGIEMDRLLPAEHFAAWVERLSALARARPEDEERAFASVRGPHSQALTAWLAENGGRYDVALVQGIPFDTVPSAVEALGGLARRPRIVVLPHFHGEDRFYYWRRYLDSFAAADKVLLFSRDLAGRLGDPSKNAVVPGGGIKIEEEASPELVARFRELHDPETPFFLVLGRKTASKGYDRVIRALRGLREKGWELDLVVIGPDDDGVEIEEGGVDYLGFQPREVVLGALSACLGLVTMSRSESFGIVICEAWKFKKPVIANRACAAFRELVGDGEAALLVDTDEELATAMEKFALDPELCARLGEAGFERAVSAFAWQQVAGLVGEVLIG